jgi:hypothetical protein
MPKRHVLTIFPALLALVVACASEPPIFTAFDPLSTFPATATYVWDDEANTLPDNPNIHETGVGAVVKQLATDGMAKRGYTVAESGTPPYRLSYQMEVHTWISQEQSSSTAALALRLTDYLSDRTVWLGTMSIEVDLARSVEERRALLQATFSRLLANFPPGQPKQ